MTPTEETRQQAAVNFAKYVQAMANRPICSFCHALATVKLGGLFCCDVHGKKYSGYNSEYNKMLRGEINDSSNAS